MRPCRQRARRCSTLLVALAILAWARPARAEPGRATTLERIDAAHGAGLLDGPTRDLYRAYRVLDRSRLPVGLRAPRAAERPLRCGTPILRAARRALPLLPATQRADLESLLYGEPTPYADSHFSAHFELVVGANGTDQANIDMWLDALELAWDVHVTDVGFALPPCTDTQPLRVYLGSTGPDVPAMEPDVYGWTELDGSGCPFMVVQDSYPLEADPIGIAQVTGAHELHHGFQAAYDWDAPPYWSEATAVWAEDLVFDAVNDYLWYVNDGEWLSRPHLALSYEDEDHEYGNVLWALYLSEQHGGSRAIRRIWERCSFSAPTDAMEGYLQDQGSSLEAAFVGFTAHLATADFADGDLYDTVLTLADVSDYPTTEDFTAQVPESYGSAYVTFEPAPGPVRRLDVTFHGTPQRGDTQIRWGVALVAETAAGWTHQTLAVDVIGDAFGGVNSFGGDVERVVLAVSVLGPAGATPGTGGVPFGYEARLHEDVPLPDAGPAGDARPAPVDRSKSGCGCAATPGADPSFPLLLLVLGLGWAVTSRRRRLPGLDRDPRAPRR